MITFIVGLPGSGKTYLARKILETAEARGERIELVDDPRTQEDRERIVGLVRAGASVIVCDPHLCFPEDRKRARAQFPDATWIFFANDPDAARANVRWRNDGRLVDTFISILAPVYDPPLDALPIWQSPVAT